MHDIYSKLRERLDHLSIGFPSTEGGEEYAVPESRFSVKDAEYACELSTIDFETSAELAARIGKDEETVAKRLDAMVRKGLIFFKRTMVLCIE
jgi:hypothetical protein